MPHDMPGLAILLGKMKKKPSEDISEEDMPPSEGDEGDKDEQENQCIEELMAAKTAQEFKDCLVSFLTMHFPQLEEDEDE